MMENCISFFTSLRFFNNENISPLSFASVKTPLSPPPTVGGGGGGGGLLSETTDKWFKTDESKKYLKEMIIHPVGQIIYNEFYVYLWFICIYHVFLIFLVLANLYFLLYYRNSLFLHPMFLSTNRI